MRMFRADVLAAVVVSGSVSIWAQASPAQAPAPQAAAPPAELALDRSAADRSGGAHRPAANGLTLFHPPERRPANRVSMRLAVNAGAIQEDDRSARPRALHRAHGVQRHASTSSRASWCRSSSRSARASVRTSTPRPSFDETIYMLDIPTDRPGYVDRGPDWCCTTSPAAFSLLPEEIEKERGVVLEEWRGRLGAGSRLTDKQLPVIFQGSRYAERLPIGLPEILQERAARAAARVLPEVVPPGSDGGGGGRRHPGRPRPRRWCSAHFAGIPRRERRRWRTVDPHGAVAQGNARQHVHRSRSAGLVGVGRVQAQGRERARRCAAIARRWSQQPRLADAQPAPARDRAAAERAVPRRGGRRQQHRPLARAVRARARRCRRARSPQGSAR